MIPENINQNPNLKPLNFILVLCKTRKKLDKYIKLNRISKKYIIDITKMMLEENIKPEDISTSNVFKLMIFKKFNMAKEKKRDIYYIPSFEHQSNISKLFNIKQLIETTHNFNLMYFYEDFTPGEQPQEILERIGEFDISQLIEDY